MKLRQEKVQPLFEKFYNWLLEKDSSGYLTLSETVKAIILGRLEVFRVDLTDTIWINLWHKNSESEIVDDMDLTLEDLERVIKDQDFTDFEDFLDEEAAADEEYLKGGV